MRGLWFGGTATREGGRVAGRREGCVTVDLVKRRRVDGEGCVIWLEGVYDLASGRLTGGGMTWWVGVDGKGGEGSRKCRAGLCRF